MVTDGVHNSVDTRTNADIHSDRFNFDTWATSGPDSASMNGLTPNISRMQFTYFTIQQPPQTLQFQRSQFNV